MVNRGGNENPLSFVHSRLFLLYHLTKKNAPAKRQERMSLEGSAPLSQNPEGNTAAAISDVNDNRIIAHEWEARTKAAL